VKQFKLGISEAAVNVHAFGKLQIQLLLKSSREMKHGVMRTSLRNICEVFM